MPSPYCHHTSWSHEELVGLREKTGKVGELGILGNRDFNISLTGAGQGVSAEIYIPCSMLLLMEIFQPNFSRFLHYSSNPFFCFFFCY